MPLPSLDKTTDDRKIQLKNPKVISHSPPPPTKKIHTLQRHPSSKKYELTLKSPEEKREEGRRKRARSLSPSRSLESKKKGKTGNKQIG